MVPVMTISITAVYILKVCSNIETLVFISFFSMYEIFDDYSFSKSEVLNTSILTFSLLVTSQRIRIEASNNASFPKLLID